MTSHYTRRITEIMVAVILMMGRVIQSDAQSEQRIDVKIKEFTFVTQQVPLRLGVPTVITIHNQDAERHDFGSSMFEGAQTKVESEGVSAYGKGIGGVLLDAKRHATIRFTMDRPGRHEFRCSIHPNMKGELLLMTVEAV